MCPTLMVKRQTSELCLSKAKTQAAQKAGGRGLVYHNYVTFYLFLVSSIDSLQPTRKPDLYAG